MNELNGLGSKYWGMYGAFLGFSESSIEKKTRPADSLILFLGRDQWKGKGGIKD